MKDDYTKSEVKLIRHNSTVLGIVLGIIAAAGIGIAVKKATGANVTDGAEKAFDGAVKKIKHFVNKHRGTDDSDEDEDAEEPDDDDGSESSDDTDDK